MNKKRSKIIGLTGQSGAGKTTAAKFFRNSGFAVIDADAASREVMEVGTPCYNEVVAQFGHEFLSDDKTIDRRKLGIHVFANRNELKKLEKITFKHIMKNIRHKIAVLQSKGAEYILLDAPTLFESGANRLCDATVSVISPKEKRLVRIMLRDKLHRQDAENRLASQHDEEFFKKNSDYIIVNDGDEADLKKRVSEICVMIKSVGVGSDG